MHSRSRRFCYLNAIRPKRHSGWKASFFIIFCSIPQKSIKRGLFFCSVLDTAEGQCRRRPSARWVNADSIENKARRMNYVLRPLTFRQRRWGRKIKNAKCVSWWMPDEKLCQAMPPLVERSWSVCRRQIVQRKRERPRIWGGSEWLLFSPFLQGTTNTWSNSITLYGNSRRKTISICFPNRRHLLLRTNNIEVCPRILNEVTISLWEVSL